MPYRGVQCCISGVKCSIGVYSAVWGCTVLYRGVQCCKGVYSAV